MRPGRTLLALLPTTLLASLAAASPARAIYGPPFGGAGAEIVSVDNASDEQANAPTTDADISGNGLYVVFQTRATNFFEGDGESVKEQQENEPPGTIREGGIFRYNVLTGQIQIVASGNLVAAEGPKEGELLVRGAENPSVSADGQYVAFSSAQPLVSQTAEREQQVGYGNVDVYVRDMDKLHPVEEGGYTLVSALNHSEEAPAYEAEAEAGGDPGSELWQNTAISADGRYVLFRTEAKSSLPEGSTPTTPADQLFVRDLQEQTTTLVTQTPAGEQAGGAVGPASLSADGSTVVWVGEHAPEQTPFARGESLDETTLYYMWRRWQEAGAKTRRITGIAEPESQACQESGEEVVDAPSAEGPCYGPLSYPESSRNGIGSESPALSADGYTVAFLTGSGLRPGYATKPEGIDVFITSMAPGVSRKAGTRELTLAANGTGSDANASISSLTLSADGSRAIFSTQRNQFVLAEPEPLGSFSEIGQATELYVIDLAADTLERAVLGVDEAEPNGSVAGSPTVSENGLSVAFISKASNLIAGDANQVADAFIADYEPPAGTALPEAGVNALPEGFSLSSEETAELGVSVKRGRRAGEELLEVSTPAAGSLSARATGLIVQQKSSKHSGSHAKRGKKAQARHVGHVTLARAQAAAKASGSTTLVLRLSSEYAKDLAQSHKLAASVTIDFKPKQGGEPLSTEVALTFRSKAASGHVQAKHGGNATALGGSKRRRRH